MIIDSFVTVNVIDVGCGSLFLNGSNLRINSDFSVENVNCADRFFNGTFDEAFMSNRRLLDSLINEDAVQDEMVENKEGNFALCEPVANAITDVDGTVSFQILEEFNVYFFRVDEGREHVGWNDGKADIIYSNTSSHGP